MNIQKKLFNNHVMILGLIITHVWPTYAMQLKDIRKPLPELSQKSSPTPEINQLFTQHIMQQIPVIQTAERRRDIYPKIECPNGCGKIISSNLSSIRSHTNTHCPLIKKPKTFQCDACKKIFKSRQIWLLHTKDHCIDRIAKTYHCPFSDSEGNKCPYTATSYSTMYYHKKRYCNFRPNPQSYACLFAVLGCKKIYTNPQSFKRHTKTCNFNPQNSSK